MKDDAPALPSRRRRRRPGAFFLLVAVLGACAAVACATKSPSGFDARPLGDAGPDGDLAPDAQGPGHGILGDAMADARSSVTCGAPPTPAGAEAPLAPALAGHYKAYNLGPVPGVPGRLGGCVIKLSAPDTLLIAGDSEAENGAIYSIRVKREPCGHIVGWDGTATKLADTPHVDANLVYGPNDVLFYSQWPVYKLSQLLPGAATPSRDIDLRALGMIGGGAGGIGFVPPNLAGAGGLRAITWPDGLWYHVQLATDGALFRVPGVTQTAKLESGPGGFAYIPAGSPGFPKQSVIVAEWSADRVATYEVDEQGDPSAPTRAEFFTEFPRPWGAYFEPLTGDFLFLTWGAAEKDGVYIVQGFLTPPPPPPPPR